MSKTERIQQLVNEYIEEVEALNGDMIRNIDMKVGFDILKSLLGKGKIYAQSDEGDIHPLLALLLLNEKDDIIDTILERFYKEYEIDCSNLDLSGFSHNSIDDYD